jgi:hypothetical protein
MGIATDLTRIANAKTAIAAAIAAMGVTVPPGTKIDGLAALIPLINTLHTGVNPPVSPAVGKLWRYTTPSPDELLEWTGLGTSNARSYAASKSGASVTIQDLRDDNPALGVTVKTIASQAGSGTPSPANIRAISGKASVKATVNGTDRTLTPATPIYGLVGYEDEIGNDGHVTRRTALATYSAGFGLSGTQPTNTLFARFAIGNEGAANAAVCLCSMFPWVTGVPNDTSVECCCSNPGTNQFIIFVLKTRMTGWSDAWSYAQKTSAFNALLAAWNTAGTPMQVLYQLATPVTSSVAPIQITGAGGANIVTSDGASVVVTYTGSGWKHADAAA